jgi:hypothetical protein
LNWLLERNYLRMCLSVLVLLPALGISGRCQAFGSRDAHECERAADRLRAHSQQEKSWGAHWAIACQLTGLAGEIEAELAQAQPEALAKFTWNSESFWMAHSMLDALIQLHRPVSTALLESISKTLPIEGTILMLQYPADNRRLLEGVHARSGGAEWVAASNALTRMRAPGFAATLLVEIPLSHAVLVSDNGDAPGRGMAGSIASGGPTVRVPPDFPPVGIYRLTAQHSADAQLRSDGSLPIYSHRTVLDPGVEQTLNYPPEGYCSRCLEIEYLAELAGTSRMEVDRTVDWQTALRWTNLLQFNAELSRAPTEQESALKHLASSLVSAGVLDNSELQMVLHIDVSIQDRRSEQSVPLPKCSPVEFRLR